MRNVRWELVGVIIFVVCFWTAVYFLVRHLIG
jgi:hypothetical protein